MDLTVTTYEQDMLTMYQREKTIVPYQRLSTPFLNAMKEVGTVGLKPGGNVLEFLLRLHAGYGVGTPNDGGQWARARAHRSIKAQVTRAMIDAALSITVETEAAAKDDGSFRGDALQDAVSNTLLVYYWQKNVLSLGHGTGRLSIVAADAAATDTVTFDLPEGIFQFREGLFVEFADIDVGGTVQNLGVSGLEVQVIALDRMTHTVTFSSPITVTAGWGAYPAGTYGARKPNGLRSFIDNGALTTTIMGINRAANPQVNAFINDNGGGLADYSEAGVRDILTQIRQVSGMVPTGTWSNDGIVNEHLRFTTPDRVFPVAVNEGVPKYNIGADESKLRIYFGSRMLKMEVDADLPARSLYFVYGPGYRSHTLIPDDWLKGDRGLLHWAPADGGGTYKNVLIGEMQGCYNTSHKQLNAQGAWLNLRDRDSARD